MIAIGLESIQKPWHPANVDTRSENVSLCVLTEHVFSIPVINKVLTYLKKIKILSNVAVTLL